MRRYYAILITLPLVFDPGAIMQRPVLPVAKTGELVVLTRNSAATRYIDSQGRYVIDRTVFTFTTAAALADTLKKVAGDAKEPVVIINADANATHQSVIHVMEAARMAGYIHITFATQSPPPK